MAEGGWGSGQWGEAAWGRSVYYPAVADGAAATDSVVSRVNFGVARTESTAVSDTRGASIGFLGTQSESATLVDLAFRGQPIDVFVAETSTGLESLQTRADFRSTQTEAVSGTDSVLVRVGFRAVIQDGATGADEIIGRKLWEPVDDTQSPDWQNTDNAQGAGWTPTDTN